MQESHVKLAPWETEIIEKLDDAFVAEYSKTQQARMQADAERRRQKQQQD
jgi:hypothetical protein